MSFPSKDAISANNLYPRIYVSLVQISVLSCRPKYKLCFHCPHLTDSCKMSQTRPPLPCLSARHVFCLSVTPYPQTWLSASTRPPSRFSWIALGPLLFTQGCWFVFINFGFTIQLFPVKEEGGHYIPFYYFCYVSFHSSCHSAAMKSPGSQRFGLLLCLICVYLEEGVWTLSSCL